MEKRPLLSQLMESIGGHEQLLRTENLPFIETTSLRDFQVKDKTPFDALRDSKRRLRGEIHPHYRLVNVYHKSTKQYWKERNRRKQVWILSGAGFTYEQIAEKLGVCIKTVQRDLKKVSPYYIRRLKAKYEQLQIQRHREIQAKLDTMNIFQQLDYLTQLMIETRKLYKVREYHRHKIKVLINMDDMAQGYPSIRPWPKSGPFPTTLPFYFEFVVRKDGKDEIMGSWIIRKA